MPMPKDVADKGNYLDAQSLFDVKVQVVQSDIVSSWSNAAFIVLGI